MDEERGIKSLEELRAYLETPELQCLICGGFYGGLSFHIKMAHRMRAAEYKMKFNIPQSTGLIGSVTREKLRACAVATTAKMREQGFPNLKKASEARGDTRTAWPTYMARDHSAKMVASPNHPSKVEGDDVMPCVDCGVPVMFKACVAVAQQCHIRCDGCRADHKKLLRRARNGVQSADRRASGTTGAPDGGTGGVGASSSESPEARLRLATSGWRPFQPDDAGD